MRALVTSGGTRAYLDEVRWLGNVSTGRFGARIAASLLWQGDEVVHLHARDAILPTEQKIRLTSNLEAQVQFCCEEAAAMTGWPERYHTIPFVDVFEYGRLLEEQLRTGRFDVVFLAAAVSDYAPEPHQGKIASGDDELVLRLRRVPKFIRHVKEWAPNVFQVGFKLLAGVDDEELIRQGLDACRTNRSDVTVANDIRSVRAGQHTVYLVRDGAPAERIPWDKDPAAQLVERVREWFGNEQRNR